MTEVVATAPAESQGTPETPVVAPRKDPVLEKYKIKIDGQEYERPFTREDLELMKDSRRVNEASTQRFQEAARLKKEAEAVIHFLNQDELDLDDFAKVHKIDSQKLEKAAVKMLEKRLQMEQLSPDQKKIMEMEERLKEVSVKEEQERKAQEYQQYQLARQQYEKRFMTELSEIVEKGDTWLDPTDPVVLGNIANTYTYILDAYKDPRTGLPTYEPTLKEILKIVESNIDDKPVNNRYLMRYLKKVPALKNVSEDDLNILLSKGLKGIMSKSVEDVKKSEAPFTQRPKAVNPEKRISTESKPNVTSQREFFAKAKGLNMKPMYKS